MAVQKSGYMERDVWCSQFLYSESYKMFCEQTKTKVEDLRPRLSHNVYFSSSGVMRNLKVMSL